MFTQSYIFQSKTVNLFLCILKSKEDFHKLTPASLNKRKKMVKYLIEKYFPVNQLLYYLYLSSLKMRSKNK